MNKALQANVEKQKQSMLDFFKFPFIKLIPSITELVIYGKNANGLEQPMNSR